MTRRKPESYNFDKLQFDERLLTKHFTSQKSKDLKYVVIHHMVVKDRDVNDDDALDTVYNIWQSRPASAHYGVDGKFIAQYVWDKDYAWATGNTQGNRHGISIEHANTTLNEPGTKNDYKVSEETWKNGAKLTAYIHKVYGLGRPVKNKTIRKHSSFSATQCPGPYIDRIWDDYVKHAQSVYDEITGKSTPKKEEPKKSTRVLRSGAKGSDVKALQTALNKVFPSYSKLVADGIFGANTANVVKEFQRRSGLSADGIVGPKTRAELAKHGVTF